MHERSGNTHPDRPLSRLDLRMMPWSQPCFSRPNPARPNRCTSTRTAHLTRLRTRHTYATAPPDARVTSLDVTRCASPSRMTGTCIWGLHGTCTRAHYMYALASGRDVHSHALTTTTAARAAPEPRIRERTLDPRAYIYSLPPILYTTVTRLLLHDRDRTVARGSLSFFGPSTPPSPRYPSGGAPAVLTPHLLHGTTSADA